MNLHGAADGVARVFGAVANGGALHGVRLLTPQAIAAMTEMQSERADLLLGFAVPWARGVALNATGVFGANPRAFGHTGWGGSFGYADLEAGIGAAYVKLLNVAARCPVQRTLEGEVRITTMSA